MIESLFNLYENIRPFVMTALEAAIQRNSAVEGGSSVWTGQAAMTLSVNNEQTVA